VSNGDPNLPVVIPNFGPFPFSPLGPGQVLEREPVRSLPNGGGIRDAGLPAPIIPFPIPVPPSVPTFPGPNIPAANQPFPPGGGAGSVARLGRLIRGGFILGILIETAAAILRRKRELDEERDRQESLAEIAAEGRRRSARQREALIETLPRRERFTEAEGKEIFDFPALDVPGTVSAPAARADSVDFPLEIPDISAPFPVPNPVISPQIPEIPEPAPVTDPEPGPVFAPVPGFGVPGAVPFPTPATFPIAPPAAFPSFRPASFPRFRPVGDPLPPRLPLTPVGGPALGFASVPDPIGVPLQETNPDRKCKEVKRRRRKKGKCQEGFFKEFPNRTRFITWRETDCDIRGI